MADFLVGIKASRVEEKMEKNVALATFKWRYLAPVIFVVTLSGSCANLVQVKVDVVDQRTALENQVLGSYADIEGDQMQLASVRSIDSDGVLKEAPKIPEKKKMAIRAMQRSLFNRDDVDQAKSEGMIGEGKDGYLYFFEPDTAPADPRKRAFVKNLVAEENEDRNTLYTRIAEVNRAFEENDIEKVATIMAGLNRDAAPKGELIQTDSGVWIVKK